MKALVLNGATDEKDIGNTVSDYLVDFLRVKGHEVDVLVLRNKNIASCVGCFGCWLKSPGKCIIKDDASDLPHKVMQSNWVFLLTPVTFGMYSSELKKAMDRYACPILLPFFQKIDGEIHHSNRYDKYPTLVAVGILPNSDEDAEKTFSTLVSRNAINLHTKAMTSFVYSTDRLNAIKEKTVSTLSKVGIQ